MLSYYTYLYVNNHFNKDLLLDMLFKWMYQSQYQIEKLVYNNEEEFFYECNNIELHITDFKEQSMFSIVIKEEKQLFIDIEYSYISHIIYLRQYNHSLDDIPQIFKTIIESRYIISDGQLKNYSNPLFITKKHYKIIKDYRYYMPIVLLYRHKKCCLNPTLLAKKIEGIGHVVCIFNKNKELKKRIKIIYPNNEIEILENNRRESVMINNIYQRIRNYMILQYDQYNSFDDLIRLRLDSLHNQEIQSVKEFKAFFTNEIANLEHDIEELEKEFELKKQEYKELEMMSQELSSDLDKYNQESIMKMNKKDKNYSDYLDTLINNSINDLADSEVYRKRDILTSIRGKNV
jgi:hypothetical protein